VTAAVNWAKAALRLGRVEFIIAIVAVGALVLLLRPRSGRRWITAVALVYWFLSTPFGGRLMVAPLASGFHSIENPEEARSAGAIVVLGGGVREVSVRGHSLAYPYDTSTLRVLEGVRVYRLLNGAPLMVASGGIVGEDQRTPEGSVLAEAMVRLGVPHDNIIVESSSQTTREQAILVTNLLRSRGIERFVLVTSPQHISRSVAVFRAQHADVVPSTAPLTPDHSRRPMLFMPSGEFLGVSDDAVYAYAAVAYYWARGWFRPAPATAAK